MIPFLIPAFCKLENVLQRKFIGKIKFSSDDTTKNVFINVGDARNVKPLSKIDVGTKAKTLLSKNIIMASDAEKKFPQDCFDFCVTAVQYPQSNLPYDVSLMQHAQYIHPHKRNASESLSAISNLVVRITPVLNSDNCLYKVFCVKNASTDFIIDQDRSQWQFFEDKDIKKERYQLDENEVSLSTSRKKDSY